MSLAKKLKMIIKGEPKPTFGTDPNDPWSVRAGITESETSMLGSYLKSRGINPEFVSKDTKISHAKSTEFSKWKRDHNFDDPADYVSSAARDKMKSQREEVQFDEAKTIQGTALDKFRQAAAERARKHDDIEREMKARHAAGKEDMKGSIDRLEKQLNKEESEVNEADQKFIDSLNKLAKTHKVGDSVTVNSKFFGKQKGKVTKVDNQSVHVVRDGKSSAEKYPHDAVVKEESGISKTKETSFHKKLDTLVHNTFGKRKDELKIKEEVVTEMDKTQTPPGRDGNSVYDPEAHAGKKAYTGKPVTSVKVKKDLLKLLNKNFNKEEVVTEKNDSHTHAAHYEDPKTGEWTGMNLLIAKDDEDAIRQANEKCKEGCRLTKVERHITVKEDVEQIDELNYDTVKSLYKKRRDDFHGDQVGKKKKGKEVSAKNVSRSISRLTGFKPTQNQPQKEEVPWVIEDVEQIDELKMSTVKSYHKKRLTDFSYSNKKPGETSTKPRNARIKKVSAGVDRSIDRQTGLRPTSEDVFQDTQAATQTPFDMGTQADDREPTYSRKKEMSKSARMIKALYKKHKMVKEELYDHEKEDKSVATYGRKPKVEKVQVDGDENNQAAMVLKGGKTLTGQTRDTLEIDPIMRKPSNSDNKNNSTKTDK
jgi:hypothetical protein